MSDSLLWLRRQLKLSVIIAVMIPLVAWLWQSRDTGDVSVQLAALGSKSPTLFAGDLVFANTTNREVLVRYSALVRWEEHMASVNYHWREGGTQFDATTLPAKTTRQIVVAADVSQFMARRPNRDCIMLLLEIVDSRGKSYASRRAVGWTYIHFDDGKTQRVRASNTYLFRHEALVDVKENADTCTGEPIKKDPV